MSVARFLRGLFHHEEGKVFKDPVVTILIRCGKCRFRYWITPHSKVITFGLVSLQCNDNITQALTVTELSEHECHELIPAGEVLDIPVPIILVNQVTELVVVEKCNQLSEYIFVFVHRAVPLWAAKLQIQIVAHEKLLLIDYVSTISKTDLPAFTGQ